MKIRSSSDQSRLTLKGAVRHGINLAGGGENFQHATRVNAGTLSKYASPEWLDNHIPLDIALDLDLDIGEPVCARALAAAQGYELIRPSKASNGTAAKPLAALSGITREHADLVASICDCALDGIITENERRSILKDIFEFQSALTRLVDALEDGEAR